MVIVIACDVLGRETNGTEVAAGNLIRYLKRRGHEVRVLCADQYKKGQRGYFIVPNRSFGPLDRYVEKSDVTIARPDYEVIRAALDGADVVHVMMPLPLGLATVRVARELNIPITAGFHMQAENATNNVKLGWSRTVNDLVYRFIWNRLYSHCAAIHYPTQFIRDVFENSLGFETPGHVISNGVNPAVKPRVAARPEEYRDRFVILSTGRYSKEKSQDTLLRAVALSKYRNRIQVVLAGRGPLEHQYRHLGSKLPNQPLFHLFSRDEIIDAYNWCDMYVHPAVAELEGIAVLEAIACGKLTLVSDSKQSATSNFAVDDRCIFKAKDPAALAQSIDYWIEHPEEAKEVADLYLHSAQALSLDACMSQMEEMLYQAAGINRLGAVASPLTMRA